MVELNVLRSDRTDIIQPWYISKNNRNSKISGLKFRLEILKIIYEVKDNGKETIKHTIKWFSSNMVGNVYEVT